MVRGMKQKKYLFLFFLIAVFCAYGNSLKGDFIWDDKPLIVDNPVVRNPPSVASIFSAELYAQSRANYYRPLVTLSFILNSLFAGSDPFGYHLVNILLHAFVGWLLYLFLIRAGVSHFIAFAASSLFLIHPIHAQVVTYISGRADSLVALFLMASLIFSCKVPQEQKSTLAACLLFILALLTKETAVVFPLVMVGVDRWVGFSKKASLKKTLPFFVIAGIYVMLRISLLNFSFENPFVAKKGFAIFEIGFLERFFIFTKTMAIYLGFFLAPFHLHMERIIVFERIDFPLGAGLGGCLVLVWLTLQRARKSSAGLKKLLAFFLFWFFVWLLPQSAFVFPKIMAEHFLYLSSMSLCFFGAFLLDSMKREKLKKAIFFAALFYFASLSWQNNKDWSSELRFFERTVALSPHSVRARDSLASLYLEQNRYHDAELEYKRILGLKSTFAGHPGSDVVEASAYYNLGILYEKRDRVAEAVLAYRAAIMVNPKMEKAYNNIGLLYQRMGDASKAQESFKKAIELDGRFYQAYNNLATLYAQRGDNKSAMGLWQKALLIKSDYETAWKNIALAKELVKSD